MEIRIASVEDSDIDYESLMENIHEYALKRNVTFTVDRYKDGEEFLQKYRSQYDIIFMDIVLVAQNGMKTAKELRKVDADVALIFITSNVQYAVEGYDVEAKGYILKPIKYYSFQMQLDKIIAHLHKSDDCITIRNRSKVLSLSVSNIKYVEISGHDVSIHTLSDTTMFYGTLTLFEDATKDYSFSRCSASVLVNLMFVREIKGNDVILNTGEVLPIGRTKKISFISDYASYKGGLL